MLNWEIIKHPMNWLTVVLMVVIASFAWTLLFGPANRPAE